MYPWPTTWKWGKKIKWGEREKFLGHTGLIFKRETRSTLLDFRPRYFAVCGSSDTRRSSLVLHRVFSRRNYLTFLEILQLITRPPSHMPVLRLENGGSDVERVSLRCFMEPGGLFDIVIGVQ